MQALCGSCPGNICLADSQAPPHLLPPWLGALRLPHHVALQGGKTSLFDRTCAQGTAGPALAERRFMRADARCILSWMRALTRLQARIRSARAELACVPNADLLAEFIRRSGR